MTTELEERLHAAGSDLHLDRPLAEVEARGAFLRRRRRRTWAGAAAGVVLVACGAATVVAQRPSDPGPVATDPTPPMTASPRPAPTADGSTQSHLAAAERACRPGLPDLGVPRDQAPLAGGSRDGLAILLYHDGDRSAVCTTKRGAGGRVESTGGQANVWNPLLPGQSFRPVALMTGALAGAHTVDGMALFLVRADVAQLVLHMDGADVDAEVHDGVAIAWLPDDLRTSTFQQATVTTYDGGGSVLEDRPAPTDPVG